MRCLRKSNSPNLETIRKVVMRIFYKTLSIIVLAPHVLAGQSPIAIFAPGPGFVAGNGDLVVPFNLLHQPVRYQQVFAASDFPSIVQGGGLITTISFAGDEKFGGGFGILGSVQIDLSTTTRGPDNLSSIFSQNPSSDDTIVFGPARMALAGAQVDYQSTFTLSHPFFYNPAAGNLLLDVRNFSGIDYTGG